MATNVRFGEPSGNPSAAPVLISLPHVLLIDSDVAAAAEQEQVEDAGQDAASIPFAKPAPDRRPAEGPVEIGSSVDFDPEAAEPAPNRSTAAEAFHRPDEKRSGWGAIPKVLVTLVLLFAVYVAYTGLTRPPVDETDPAEAPTVQIDLGEEFGGLTIEAPGLGDLDDLDSLEATAQDDAEPPLSDEPPDFPELSAPPLDSVQTAPAGQDAADALAADAQDTMRAEPSAGAAPADAAAAPVPPQSMGPDYRYNPYPRTETPDDTVEFLRMTQRSNDNTAPSSAPGMSPTPPFGESGNDSDLR